MLLARSLFLSLLLFGSRWVLTYTLPLLPPSSPPPFTPAYVAYQVTGRLCITGGVFVGAGVADGIALLFVVRSGAVTLCFCLGPALIAAVTASLALLARNRFGLLHAHGFPSSLDCVSVKRGERLATGVANEKTQPQYPQRASSLTMLTCPDGALRGRLGVRG